MKMSKKKYHYNNHNKPNAVCGRPKIDIDGVKIHFIGTASDEVTGSCVWIESPEFQVLVECGLNQSEPDVLKQYLINNERFPFDPKKIDYVFACHCHTDHIGKIPRLYRLGCTGKFIMPKNSRLISETLMNDSANIMKGESNWLSKKYGRHYKPTFEKKDVVNSFEFYEEYPIGQKYTLDKHISFRFVSSGHILNSAQLELWISYKGKTKKVVYTSDLGNLHISKRYVNKFIPSDKCNILIGESTYGAEERIASMNMRKKEIDRIKSAIERSEFYGGKILIPVFANDRCQNILTLLYEIYGNDKLFNLPIIIDTPLGAKICDAYKKQLRGANAALWSRVCRWKNVHFARELEDSMFWRTYSGSLIVLASSGMLDKGRAKEWCRKLLTDSRNSIIFCGYSTPDTVAWHVKEKKPFVKIDKEFYPSRAKIEDLHSFTSHMQKDDLLKYYSRMDCESIILCHGEKSSKESLCVDLKKEISKLNKTTNVIIAEKGLTVKIL